MKLDDKDIRIIAELEKNSNQTTHKLSKKLNYPVTTIYNRIKKLEKEGVIKRYTVDLDHKKLGKPIVAILGITITRGSDHMDVARAVRRLDGVFELNMMTGGTDFLVKVRVKDIDELNTLITRGLATVDGIDKSQTAIVLNGL